MAKRKAYQDRASGKAQSQAWNIEAKNVSRFQRAFVNAMRGLYDDPKIQTALARIIRESRSIDAGVQAVDDLLDKEKLAAQFEQIYVDVLQETGTAELKREKIPADFEVVAKRVEGIPVNRFSVKWINDRAGELIRQITEAERRRVRQILARNVGRRINAPFVQDQIASTVGLLPAEELRAQAVFDAAIADGVPRAAARARSGKIAARLLAARGERIARTETIQAQNQGKLDSWRVAGDNGLVPPGTKKTWVAATDSERTCRICGAPPDAPDGLDGQQVPVNEPFVSEIVGPLDRPPAHPNCRCTMTLSFPEAA